MPSSGPCGHQTYVVVPIYVCSKHSQIINKINEVNKVYKIKVNKSEKEKTPKNQHFPPHACEAHLPSPTALHTCLLVTNVIMGDRNGDQDRSI